MPEKQYGNYPWMLRALSKESHKQHSTATVRALTSYLTRNLKKDKQDILGTTSEVRKNRLTYGLQHMDVPV